MVRAPGLPSTISTGFLLMIECHLRTFAPVEANVLPSTAQSTGGLKRSNAKDDDVIKRAQAALT